MLEVSNVYLPLDAGLPGSAADDLIRNAAACTLGVDRDALGTVHVLKRSIDARKKRDVHFVATLGVQFAHRTAEDQALVAAEARGGEGATKGTHVKRYIPPELLSIPSCASAFAASGEPRPVVVGTGPAGLFCALYLARAGLRPLVIERGGNVDERLAAVDAFNAGGPLDLQTNIQFGEGGAGTFSDGKLTTGIKSPFARTVLQWFVDAGAPEEILWQAKPHIGTDRLVQVLRNLRSSIEQAGGEVRFHTQLVAVRSEKGALTGVELLDTRTGLSEQVPACRVVVACGHSARDTFEMLLDAGFTMEQKPFSVGVRIEHLQDDINRAQYGKAAGHPALGAADYKLSVQVSDYFGSQRGVYTFCMCPGGEVTCAASEDGGVVVNGMSRYARDGKNANSAVLVGVGPDDFEGDHPLAGVALQRSIEHAAYQTAYKAGGVSYEAPAQTVGDFLSGRSGTPSATVQPTYARGVAWCDLHACLPTFVTEALEAALPLLDQKLQGFTSPNAIMTGVETRSSSPVRIVRGKNLQACAVFSGIQGKRQATSASGLYPCGEGAGYAGGIMSSACDGLRVARGIVQAFAKIQA